MAVDLEQFLEPISDAEPCGPDLELEFDMDFMNFIARAEGLLPARFSEFDPNSIDFNKEYAQIVALLERTRDLRLFVLYAKLAVLSRDGVAFIKTLETIATLLESRWNEVHPRSEGGDYMLRVAVIQSLEDAPHVILPLQSATLVQSRRYGPLSFRSLQIASEKIVPREGETFFDMSTIDRILWDSELEVIVAKRDEVRRIVAACEKIEATSMEAGGYDGRIVLSVLSELAGEIVDFLDRHIVSRDPAAAPAAEEEASDDDQTSGSDGQKTGTSGQGNSQAVTTRKDALLALKAVRKYFEAMEPSSPALMLIGYSENLMHKTFYEVIQALMPDYFSRASILIGQNAIKLNMGVLSSNSGGGGYNDGYSQSAEESDDAAESGTEFSTPSSRREAFKLMDAIVNFLRQSEPGSPIPLLITRAKEIGERDFVNLIKELFTESELRLIKGESAY